MCFTMWMFGSNSIEEQMSFRMQSISSTIMERHASNAANNLNLEYTAMLKIIYIWCYIKEYSTQKLYAY